MKLMSPSVVKDTRQNELRQQLLRAKEVDEITNTINIRRAKSEVEFNESLARNRAKWALEEEEHAKRVKDMESEVKVLESQKQHALIPIHLYKKKADELMAEAEAVMEKVQEKERNVDATMELLETKLTDVGDREIAVAKEESRQTVAKLGIESQQEEVKVNIQKSMDAIYNFNIYRLKEEENLSERKKEVALAEISFKAKTDKYKRDLEALKIFDIQLKDERATLDREIARQKK